MNTKRSKHFAKVNDSINSSATPDQLRTCLRMLETASDKLSFQEITTLQQYLLDAWDRLNRVGESFADETETAMMKTTNNSQK